MRMLRRLDPNTFDDDDERTSFVPSSTLSAIDYVKRVSREMLDCHDERIPEVLRDLYKEFIDRGDERKCLRMSLAFEHIRRSYSRLTFYKDVAQLVSGMVTNRLPRLIPLDRGIKAVDIDIDDVFNDIMYRLDGRGLVDAAAKDFENPYVRMFRSIMLETLREYSGNVERGLFKEKTRYAPTDRALVKRYADKSSVSRDVTNASTQNESNDDDTVLVATRSDDTVDDDGTFVSSANVAPLESPGISGEATTRSTNVIASTNDSVDDDDDNGTNDVERVLTDLDPRRGDDGIFVSSANVAPLESLGIRDGGDISINVVASTNVSIDDDYDRTSVVGDAELATSCPVENERRSELLDECASVSSRRDRSRSPYRVSRSDSRTSVSSNGTTSSERSFVPRGRAPRRERASRRERVSPRANVFDDGARIFERLNDFARLNDRANEPEADVEKIFIL